MRRPEPAPKIEHQPRDEKQHRQLDDRAEDNREVDHRVARESTDSLWDANIPSRATSLLSQSSVGLKDIEHPSSLLPIRVQARCISSERHVKAWPCTSGPLSPYTLRKYGARQTCLVRLRLAQQRDEEERSDDPG